MSPRRAIPESKKQGGLPTWVIALGIGVVVVVAVVVLFTLQTPSAWGPSTGGLSAASRTKGAPNAQVALVEFSDFQ